MSILVGDERNQLRQRRSPTRLLLEPDPNLVGSDYFDENRSAREHLGEDDAGAIIDFPSCQRHNTTPLSYSSNEVPTSVS